MWWKKKSPPLTELASVVTTESSASVNVIFVHGLGGDSINTWNFNHTPSWHTWVSGNFPAANVWTLSYRLKKLKFFGGSMPITDRATNVLAVLKSELDPSLPIVFICHSYGGLLVKQLLRSSRDFSSQYGDLEVNTRAICFFSTPHHGSDLASYISAMRPLIRSSTAMSELRSNEPQLRNLNIWFTQYFNPTTLKLEVFYEKLPTYGALVVNDISANIGLQQVIPVPMDTNHIDICKPQNIDVRVKRVFNLIRASEKQSAPRSSSKSLIQELLSATDAELSIINEKNRLRHAHRGDDEDLIRALALGKKMENEAIRRSAQSERGINRNIEYMRHGATRPRRGAVHSDHLFAFIVILVAMTTLIWLGISLLKSVFN